MNNKTGVFVNANICLLHIKMRTFVPKLNRIGF